MNDHLHIPVLLQQCITALNIQPSGKYIDATFGRGGHSQLILKYLNNQGRLLVIDQDPAALSVAEKLAQQYSMLCISAGNFNNLSRFAVEHDLNHVDGILFDLGVSSPQLDEAERGFSFSKDGPLDMRMDNSATTKVTSARDWIKSASLEEINNVLYQYGEERFAKRIAKAITIARASEEITTTLQLAEIIKAAHPKWPKNKHPATKSFLGIRLFINQELEVLTQALEQAVELLSSGGRLVLITFHSLEDRIVKNFFKKMSSSKNDARNSVMSKLPLTDAELGKLRLDSIKLKDVQKPIKAGIIEGDSNNRARSAILRVATKV